MSITKRTVEISNKEKEDWEMNSLYMRTTEWLKQYDWFDWFDWLNDKKWYVLLLIVWIIPSIMAIKESIKCDNKMNIILSVLPIVNVIIYMSNCDQNRNGVGYKNYLNSNYIYPSVVRHEWNNQLNNKELNNKEWNQLNNSRNIPRNIPRNSSMNKPMNISTNKPMNNPINSSMIKPMNKPRNNLSNNQMNKPKNVWNKY